MKLPWNWTWLLIGFYNLAGMAQPQFKVMLDTNAMLIGDQMHLKVLVRNISPADIQLLDFAASDTTGSIEWLQESSWQNSSPGLEKEILFTVFDSGYYFLRPFPLIFKDRDQIDTIFGNDLAFQVQNPPMDSTAIKDIKPIIEEPTSLEDFYPLFLVFGIILACALLYYLYRYLTRKKKEKVELPAPLRPAHEIALEKLWMLREAKYWQKGELKIYYSELTYILREYLEGRFHVQALEETSDEILQHVKRNKLFENSLFESLRHVLQTADLVKFAKGQPPVELHERCFTEVETFIRATKESDEAPNEQQGSPT